MTMDKTHQVQSLLKININKAIGTLTQKQLYTNLSETVNSEVLLPKRTPQYVRRGLFQYAMGYLERVKETEIVFLYCVDGKFYKTRNSLDLDLPKWDELPREQWGNLGDCGGFYWARNFKQFS